MDLECNTDTLTINVRGTVFKTRIQNLRNVPSNSPLVNLDKTSEYFDSSSGEFFFDRSAIVFDTILDYFTTGKLHIPSHLCAERVKEELAYWGVSESQLCRCCWKAFYQKDEDMDVLTKLLDHVPCVESRGSKTECCEFIPVAKHTQKESTWVCLNNYQSGLLAKVSVGRYYGMTYSQYIRLIARFWGV